MGHTFSKFTARVVKPCSKFVGILPSCCYNKISDNDRYELSELISSYSEPGDFILSHIDNRPTNLFLGGAPYTHLGIIMHGGFIIDMVAKGATKTPIEQWLSGKDRILVIRPKLDISQKNKIIDFVEECYKKRTPYDFSFEIGSDAIYCTELAYLALRSVDIELPVDLGLIPSVGGLLQSTTYRANSFIKSLEYGKIIPVLEWRYGNLVKNSMDVDINRLLNETLDPTDVNEESRFLFELTKLAYPFNKDRLLLIQKNQMIKKSCFPSKELNNNRKLYNMIPKGDLYRVDFMVDMPFNVYKDNKTSEVYVAYPQKNNLLHCPCKWRKLVSFDAVHGIPEALGSTEILVPNYYMKTIFIPRNVIKQGTYNYRDMYVAGKYDHYCLDILGCCL